MESARLCMIQSISNTKKFSNLDDPVSHIFKVQTRFVNTFMMNYALLKFLFLNSDLLY